MADPHAAPLDEPTAFGPLAAERFEKIVDDIDLMMSYSHSCGRCPPEGLHSRLAAFYSEEGPTTARMTEALALHTALSALVAPATPRSLRSTKSIAGGLVVNNPMVMLLIGLGTLSLVGVVVSLVRLKYGAPEDVLANGYLNQLYWLSAAGLGASFYSLFTAYRYITDRTFDPSYNQVYQAAEKGRSTSR